MEKSPEINITENFSREPGELTNDERDELRRTLTDIGVVSRRRFLTGSVVAALSLLPKSAEANTSTSIRPEPRPEDLMLSFEEKIDHAIDTLANEYEIYEETIEQLSKRYSIELPSLLKYGQKITIGDPQKRTRLQYLRSALMLPQVDPHTAEEIRALLPFKACVESRLVGDVKSNKKARGILQFMPETWKEHARTPDANRDSLVEQVFATESLITQIDKRLEHICSDSLETIKEIFFAGNEEDFQRDFKTLADINSFNAGADRIAKLINSFARVFPDSSKVGRVYDQGVIPQGKDVYKLMTHLFSKVSVDSGFGPQSSTYVWKIFAFKKMFEDNLEPSEREALFGSSTAA